MGANPLVSICIPTYNGEKFLRECIESCLHQSFSDYEIIICDDRSSDGTLGILQDYAAKSDKILLVQNEKNLGLVGNWNKCMERANGQWIKFVFQDDYISPDCLEKCVSKIKPEVNLVVSERDFLVPENLPVERSEYYKSGVKTLRNTTDFKGYYYSAGLVTKIAMENMAMNFIGEPSLIFFRKSMVQEFGYFSEALKQICDLEFVLRIAGKYGLTYIPEKLCTFRVHEDSTTTTNIKTKYFELRYIEPVVYAWFLLYSVLHANFRKHLGFFQRIKLKMYFKVKVHTAYTISKDEQRDHPLFKPGAQDFKEIGEAKNGSIFVKLISLVKK